MIGQTFPLVLHSVVFHGQGGSNFTWEHIRKSPLQVTVHDKADGFVVADVSDHTGKRIQSGFQSRRLPVVSGQDFIFPRLFFGFPNRQRGENPLFLNAGNQVLHPGPVLVKEKDGREKGAGDVVGG